MSLFPVFAIVLLFLTPFLSSLIHELGHALVILGVSRNSCEMTFGRSGPTAIDARIGRLKLVWRPLDMDVGRYDRMWVGSDAMSRRVWIATHLAGPIASLTTLAGVAALYAMALQEGASASAVALRLTLFWVLVQLLLVATPIRLPIYPDASDVLRVRAILDNPDWKSWPPAYATASQAIEARRRSDHAW